MRIAVTLLLLTACTEFPELGGTISDEARAAPYPKLTAIPQQSSTPAEPGNGQLATRIAALNARAARLRQWKLPPLQ